MLSGYKVILRLFGELTWSLILRDRDICFQTALLGMLPLMEDKY